METFDPHIFLLISVFVIGYILITIEHLVHIDKAATALVMGVLCWVLEYTMGNQECLTSHHCLMEHLASIAQIIFFLLGALAIVELISVHKGFSIIANSIRVKTKCKLLWTTGILAFFLSAILDNLTTTIVMIVLLQKLIDKGETRWLIGGAIVIAANAGGAWTPIGDVTTTMLWIGGQLTSFTTMRDLFLPSFVCLVVALIFISFMIKGEFSQKEVHAFEKQIEPKGALIFFLGVAVLIFVPVFKMLTGLPPFMGVLIGLGVLWVVTDLLHKKHEDRSHLKMPRVLAQIDFSSLLFFLGILLAVDALDTAGILSHIAKLLDSYLSGPVHIATLIGLASAVVDNVPLVAASMGMYSLEQFSIDHNFWQLIAFCAGTGGSILIIGSAAGVVFMGLEKVNFFWFLRKVSLPALISYFAGIATYLIFK